MLPSVPEIGELIAAALAEDLQDRGDVTSTLLVDPDFTGSARILAKEAGVIAGLPVCEHVFLHVDPNVLFQKSVEEGARVTPGTVVACIFGPLKNILTAERTALNFLQRLSGIATLTAKFVGHASETAARILDTRKTTPGLRRLEKYAVKVGGGENHRMGLFDMIMIKDNHITAAGGITEAVGRVRAGLEDQKLQLKIEVEAATLDQVQEALSMGVDRIMLDNMQLAEIREAVKLVSGRAELEVSGGVTLETVTGLAQTGVNFISVGALTHSAKALDLSLLLD